MDRVTKYKKTVFWKEIPKTDRKIMQIYKRGLEFSILSDKNEQCIDFVWCKDFIQDAIWASLHDKSIDYFNFLYNPYVFPRPCLKATKILVANDKDRFLRDKIPDCLDFLNQIEACMGMKSTTARECRNPPERYIRGGVWLLEGSKRWLIAPPMISLFTLLVRIGFVHIKGTPFRKTLELVQNGTIPSYQSRDNYQLKQITPVLEKIIQDGERKIFDRNIFLNYPANLLVDQIHNYAGIVSFANQVTQYKQGQKNFLTVASWCERYYK